ncbi:multiple PDZ domain protein-like [Prorops nasuta]|uniref:multiple PDZ domain protein-like n=1 Tax=Prorops nasuta TaxID=863751 RepID=UPI0034CE3C35
MPLSTDISTALHLLEHVQERVDDCDDPKLQMHTSEDLKSLISLLEDPVFRSIVTIQDSLLELNGQLGQHPSILPRDFDINISGQLELSVPNISTQPLPNMYSDIFQDSSELEDQRVPVAPLVHSSSEDTSAQVTSPSITSDVMGMPPITTPTYAKEFKKVIEAAAKGRQIFTVQLYKPDGTSLGFSVVGLRSKDRGELGIFLQEIQSSGIAGCDGRLVEGDQILAIDGQPLDSNISHEQAISILQKARGLVELVVARSAQDVGSSLPTDELSGGSIPTPVAGAAASAGGVAGAGGSTTTQTSSSDKEHSVSSVVTPTNKPGQPPVVPTPTQTPTPTVTPLPGGPVIERSPSAVSDASKSSSDMVLNTEWAQVEVINLINDGTGLGFGIIGGRSTGVVVRTILPGGVADRDNRLQSGDHILQIGDVNLRGMGSEMVASVLRQSGTHVRLVVARPVEPTSPDFQALQSHAPIVPTKILWDPEELDRYLEQSISESYTRPADSSYDHDYKYAQEADTDIHARPSLIVDVVRNPMPIGAVPAAPTTIPLPIQLPAELPVLTMTEPIDINSLPEMERFTVELKKDIYGLGITIAGYVCEKEELSGIFVKSISEGSAADLSNKIQINDRIVEVDGHSLQGYSNHEAVEVLRSTGQTVVLCLERYLRGPKFEQLQQAIAASELRLPQPSSPSITSLPSFPISADGETTTEIEPEGESHTTVDSAVLQEADRDKKIDHLEDANVEALLCDPSSELTPQVRAAIKNKWQKIVGPETEIVVAQLKKYAEGSGLGISLEGTVDVENGQEVRPHHYIRSILPEGPVGQNGTLRSGDELLEVNCYRLLGINHMEVVSVLKELPIHVRMICGRNIASQDPLCPIDTAQHQAAFQTRSILGGSLQNLLPTTDRLVKAKSDGSLASTTTTATVTDASLNKMKSRSLEPLTGLAMWSSEPQIIELVKGERGLGFSILDYQDPMNPNETVIVIRSLVPGGVAQVDGQLIPGDRLLFVNDIALENASLDMAVQALKGAPKGTVRIGVAKPLPIPDSIVQRVTTPICMIKRSHSLPNESETTDRAADLEDFLSSRSGITDLSLDKKEAEEEEEEDEDEDQWKDASPITPVCSPAKRLAMSQSEGSIAEVSPEVGQDAFESPTEEDRLPVVRDNGSSDLGTQIVRRGDEISKSVEPAAPKVKLKGTEEPEVEKSFGHRERRKKKTLKRHKSLDSETILSTEGDEGSLDKSDSLSEKQSRRRGSRRKDSSKDKSRRSYREDGTAPRRRESWACLETDRSELRMSRERRKSLREQECIDRVNEFLIKHNMGLSRPDVTQQHRVAPEVPLVEPEKRGKRLESPGEFSRASSRKSSLKRRTSETGPSSFPVPDEEATVPPKEGSLTLSKRSSLELLDDTSRPSSLKRKNVSRESSKESLLDDVRKEVRIQEDVEEIFFEEVSEDLSQSLPEVQLVKARIISVEEAAASLDSMPICKVEVHQPPEVLSVSTVRTVTSFDVGGECSGLQPPPLAKSTSDNALMGPAEVKGDGKVSQRNLKPEILLDLSKVSNSTEEGSSSPTATDDLADKAGKALLSRTGSEGSRSKTSQRHTYRLDRLATREQVELIVLDESSDRQRSDSTDSSEWISKSESRKSPSRGLQRQTRRSPSEESVVLETEGVPISKEHSLQYQSQTLESQRDGFLSDLSYLPEAAVPVEASASEILQRVVEQNIKETQFSPREKREAETQTQQENKSTQCSPEQSTGSPTEELSRRSPFHVCESFQQSPRKEVQTQTQGEDKVVQCSLEDLGDLRLASIGLPSQFQESKSVQCLPGEISADEFVALQQLPLTSPRKEVEVQTYQECKAIQCSDDELLEADYPGSYTSDGSARSSPTSSPIQFPSVVFVTNRTDMTVTHRDRDGNVAWSKHWGPERLVKIHREPKTSLGLSIVGGKVDLRNGGSSKSQNISGIFIKNVLPNSPAGRTEELKVGDRIIEVDGVDLRHSSHERAVEVIQAAGNPVCLLVQSLVHLSPEHESHFREGERDSDKRSSSGGRVPASSGAPTSSFHQRPVSSSGLDEADVIQQDFAENERTTASRSDFKRQSTRASDGAGPSAKRSSMKKSIRKKAPSPPSNSGTLRQVSEERDDNASRPERPTRKYSSEESSGEEEDTRELEGNVYTKGGMEISRKSAGNVRRSKEEADADPEQEDEYGYTLKKIYKKYHSYGKQVMLAKVEKDRLGLGISLAGHRDRNKMAVFVCGLNPKGSAYKTGGLQVGDEILEVNGQVFQGRCHLNASAMIKGMAATCFRIIVVRKSSGLNDLAVKPIVQFPATLEDADLFNHYKGVRNIPVKKGQYGLGIMIIEGKHAEVGQGIFVSDIQEGSAAEQAGLQVGDMILAVNKDSLLGSTYDQATSLLKKAEGVVTLTVCNPNQSKVAKEEEERAKGGDTSASGDKPAAKEPEKPKEPEPPQDPKDCQIRVDRDTTIEFTRDKDKSIGFTITGGSDTPQNGVFILEVFPDSAAGKDNRLQAGDQILDMNGENFKAIEYNKAHMAVLKASGTVKMVVHRKENPIEETEVELQKKSGKGAGLCCTGFKSGKGVYVSDMAPGGSALESGKICKGDRVLSVCGEDVRDKSADDIAFHMKVSNPLRLKLARYTAAKQ